MCIRADTGVCPYMVVAFSVVGGQTRGSAPTVNDLFFDCRRLSRLILAAALRPMIAAIVVELNFYIRLA